MQENKAIIIGRKGQVSDHVTLTLTVRSANTLLYLSKGIEKNYLCRISLFKSLAVKCLGFAHVMGMAFCRS